MHRNASEIFSHDLALSGVNTRSNVNAELLDCLGYRLAAANSARRTIKSRYKAVA
jgi:hypothetical protein